MPLEGDRDGGSWLARAQRRQRRPRHQYPR